jgi:hypothetical protein
MGERFPLAPLKEELDLPAKETIEPELLNEVIVQLETPLSFHSLHNPLLPRNEKRLARS